MKTSNDGTYKVSSVYVIFTAGEIFLYRPVMNRNFGVFIRVETGTAHDQRSVWLHLCTCINLRVIFHESSAVDKLILELRYYTISIFEKQYTFHREIN